MPGIYDVQTQLAAIEMLPPKSRFFRDLMVKPGITGADTEVVEFDLRKGNRWIAPFVAPNVGGIVLDRDGYETKYIKFPWIAPKRVITGADGQKRSFGEQHYSPKTEAERLAEIEAKDIVELIDSIDFREDLMVCDLLFKGKIDINIMTKDGELVPSQVVDIGFTNKITLSSPWASDAVDPNDSMGAARSLVIDGGGTPEVIIMDPASEKALFKNKTFLADYDIRNISYGMLKPEWKGPYVKYLGVNKDGLPMYSFSGTYTDRDGVVKPYVPKGTFACVTKQLFEQLCGPITLIEKDGTFITYTDSHYVPKVFVDEQGNAKERILYARPLFKPTNVDGWAIASGLVE